MPKSRSREYADFIRYVGFAQDGTPDIVGLARDDELASSLSTLQATVDAISVTPQDVSDQDNTSTGFFDLPAGTTLERPANPNIGYLRFNVDLGYLEQFTTSGWLSIATPPTLSSVSPTTFDGFAGTPFTITGINFDTGASVKFITSGGVSYTAGSVSYVNNSTLVATTPVNFTVADEPLVIRVTNASGLYSELDNAIDCGSAPTWNTASGSLGSFPAGSSVSIQLSASDPEGSSVSYSLASGGLPSGFSISSSGLITGTVGSVSSDTTYNFTVNATDGLNTSSRAFSISTVTNYFGDGTDGAGNF